MNNINSISYPTLNGLKSLDIDVLNVSEVVSNNISGNFFAIDMIEANHIKVDQEFHLSESGFITVGENTEQIIITDEQIGYLANITSDIQNQIDSIDIDTSSISSDVLQNKVDILDLQQKTVYIEHEEDKVIITKPLFFNTDQGNIRIDSNLLQINSFTPLGIYINPGGSKTIFLHSNTVEIGRTNGLLRINGLGSRIDLNGESQQFCFTNARKHQLEINTMNINTLEGNMTTAQNNIISLEGNMTTAQNDIISLEGNMTTAQNDIISIEGNMTTAQNDIISLEGNMTTAQNNIISLEGNMTTAQGNISDLQDVTQFISHQPNLVVFSQPISFSQPIYFSNANINISFGALRINTTSNLNGIVMNPGGSRVIDLHSNLVSIGRASGVLRFNGTTSRIDLNGESQSFCFTNARKLLLETNSDYISNVPFTFFNDRVDLYKKMVVYAGIESLGLLVASGSEIKAEDTDGNTIYSINNIDDDMHIETKKVGSKIIMDTKELNIGDGSGESKLILNDEEQTSAYTEVDKNELYFIKQTLFNNFNFGAGTTGVTTSKKPMMIEKRIILNGADQNYAFSDILRNDLLRNTANLVLLMNQYNKKISFGPLDFSSIQTLGFKLNDTGLQGSNTGHYDFDIGNWLKFNNSYWGSDNKIAGDFGTVSLMINMSYQHEFTGIAQIYQLRYQILILAPSGFFRYRSKIHGIKSSWWQTTAYNAVSVSQNLTIPFNNNYLGCNLILRTYMLIDNISRTNSLTTEIQMYSI